MSLSCFANGCPYIPFKNASQQIRLLSFKASSAFDLELRVFDLETCPVYAALSYRWGDADHCETIHVNDYAVQVRKTLAQALRSILHQLVKCSKQDNSSEATRMLVSDLNFSENVDLSSKYIWIDALCINQEDAEERSQQVHIMSSIYPLARLVFVYLDGRNCADALRVLRETYCDSSINKAGDPARVLERRRAVETFLDAPYWSRMWIVQEVLLATRIHFLAATEAVPLACLQQPLASAVTNRRYEHMDMPGQRVLARKIRGDRPSQRRSFRDMPDMLLELAPSKCSDPRDRVYALIGLLDDSLTPDIMPLRADYSITTDELLGRVLERMRVLENDDTFAVIQTVLHRAINWNAR